MTLANAAFIELIQSILNKIATLYLMYCWYSFLLRAVPMQLNAARNEYEEHCTYFEVC